MMSMWLVLLILMPAVMAVVAILIPSNRLRPWIIPLSGAIHLAMVLQVLGEERASAFSDWLVLDPLGKFFLLYISIFYLIIASYAPSYLSQRKERPNRTLCGCMTL